MTPSPLGIPLCLTGPSPLCVSHKCHIFVRTAVIGLEPTLVQYGFLLTWFHLQRPCFWIESHSQALPIRTSTLCREAQFHPQQGQPSIQCSPVKTGQGVTFYLFPEALFFWFVSCWSRKKKYISIKEYMGINPLGVHIHVWLVRKKLHRWCWSCSRHSSHMRFSPKPIATCSWWRTD